MEEKLGNSTSSETVDNSSNNEDNKSQTSPEETSTKADQESIPSELEAKTAEVLALNDKYLRLAAEFENFKRRAQRDQYDAIRFANEKLLKDLLPIVDNLERAIQCGSEQSKSEGLLEGVELTQKQFLETLAKLEVKQISSVGEVFDPTRHQAVAQVESETAEPNTVVEEFQKGYFLHERILRPAMVTVAKEKTTQDNSSSE